MDLSGGILTLIYEAKGPAGPALIQLKPKGRDPSAPALIGKEIAIDLPAGAGTLEIPLPAMPGLARIGEVVIARRPDPGKPALDLTITRLGFRPPHTP